MGKEDGVVIHQLLPSLFGTSPGVFIPHPALCLGKPQTDSHSEDWRSKPLACKGMERAKGHGGAPIMSAI